MYKVIYTFPAKPLRPAVTIEQDPENTKPWRVCQRKQAYQFNTFRECLAFCFGRGFLWMHDQVDYLTEHCRVDISGEISR